MKIRGALHVHSNLSHDGTLTIAELANLYQGKGFHFVAMGEHSQDMDTGKLHHLVEECGRHSTPGFCMIPGIEFTCGNGMHILGVGCAHLTTERDPAIVARFIREQDGFSVLAHPKRFGWTCAPEILNAVHAVEIWNVCYDGKFLPSIDGPTAFRAMRETNPALLAVASHDLHRERSFYNVAIELEAATVTRKDILQQLHQGNYAIRSPLFRTGSMSNISATEAWYLRFAGPRLQYLRRVKAMVLG